MCRAFTWKVGHTRVDTCPHARLYPSAGCATYPELLYPRPHSHVAGQKKEQTDNGESVNADARRSLARLVRRSRGFTRSREGLRCAVRLFPCAYNRGQLLRHEKKLKNVPGMYDCLPPRT